MSGAEAGSAAGSIRGWCPGAWRPMAAADGLVVRVRPPLGALSPGAALGLAALAARWGSGRIEMTARANLQLRGVAEAALPDLLRGLDRLGLLDADPALEARRNVILTPYHKDGDGEGDGQAAIAAAIVAGLAAPEFAALPAKFGFVVDAGPGGRALAGVSGDVRVERAGAALVVRADGAGEGVIVADGAAAAAAALEMARWFLASGGVGADGRGRMRAHLGAGALPPEALRGAVRPDPAAPPPAPGPLQGGLCVAAPFGELDATALKRLARASDGPLRATPFRMMFLPQPRGDAGLDGAPGLILRPDDPLLRVTACVGAPQCAAAAGPTRGTARALAPHVPPGAHLHVSGCAKGCARPAPAPYTLVAGAGGFDLAVGGAPWDAPVARGLSVDDARRRIES
jgi:precorrin-3B synthase